MTEIDIKNELSRIARNAYLHGIKIDSVFLSWDNARIPDKNRYILDEISVNYTAQAESK